MAEPTDNEALKQRRKDINALLDAVAYEKGLRECAVIDRYYEEQAQKTLSNLLRDVASLPDQLVFFCQELLSPNPFDESFEATTDASSTATTTTP